MRNIQMVVQKAVPAPLNPAKRIAGQLVGRWVILFGSEYLLPVARRWKTQLNEVALTSAQYEAIPDSDYNTLAGMESPPNLLKNLIVLFLRAEDLHPRNSVRLDLTREMYLQQGINTDFIDARGQSSLAHLWSLLLFGDYTAYYLAMAYGVDPSSAPAIDAFQAEMDHITQ
jgi:glucose/mannose-6-phosphate isomerase